jgi:HPt (histidine-containing phosphotransfer) domain-containing protein
VEETALENIRALQVEGEADFLTEMIDLYLTDAPLLVDRAQRSLREGDLQAARKAVHSLKGISGNLGARRLAELCQQVELQADAENLEAMQELEPKILCEFDRVCAALEKERKES